MRRVRGSASPTSQRSAAAALRIGLMTPQECRAAREKLGWTRERLGAASGTNSDFIRAYEDDGIVREARDRSDTGAARLTAVQKVLEQEGAPFPARAVTATQCEEEAR